MYSCNSSIVLLLLALAVHYHFLIDRLFNKSLDSFTLNCTTLKTIASGLLLFILPGENLMNIHETFMKIVHEHP